MLIPSTNREEKFQTRLWTRFKNFHFKHNGGKRANNELIFFRCLAILLYLVPIIVDILLYSSSVQPSFSLQFLFGAKFPFYDIASVIYGSGAVAFGLSIEIYVFIPVSIMNCVLVITQCDSQKETIRVATWVIRTMCLLVCVELGYGNFKKFQRHHENFNSSASSMLRQSLFFTVTMLFLVAPALRTVYNSINQQCLYNTSHCYVIELYEPLFNNTHSSSCQEEHIEYITSREELRILRNLVLINIAFYALFNTSFLGMG
ncbi:unnamed protein product, partial [Didymodactylos carnosus]